MTLSELCIYAFACLGAYVSIGTLINLLYRVPPMKHVAEFEDPPSIMLWPLTFVVAAVAYLLLIIELVDRKERVRSWLWRQMRKRG